MPLRRSWVADPPAWLCRLLAALLILGAATAHFLYLAHHCPLDLTPDEAHYWDWSRHLDWSYYSKGPLVAFLIRLGCAVAGPWSVAHTGSLALAVRLPAIVCGSLLLLSLYVLTVQVYRREKMALAVVALALTVPLIAAGSMLMTIDSPYTCCWGWALVLTHRALFGGGRWAWPLAGLVVGLGILAKYTMVLFLPSLGLFLLTTPAYRPLLRRPGMWSMVAVAGLCCLPIAIWNAQHNWVTVRHVLGLSGLHRPVTAESGIHWLGPLIYLGGQCALLLIFWFIAWAAALMVHHPLRESDPGLRYLWWLSAPMFLVFGLFSFKTGGGELNWPVTTYLSGLVLAAAWLTRQLESERTWYRRWTKCNLALACSVGLLLIVFMHHSEWLHPLFDRLAGPPSKVTHFRVRRFDPTCRLRGWRHLAAEVDRLRVQLAQSGREPVLVGENWSMPGELGVYCAGHPTVYSVGLALGDRHSQYDFWPGPVSDPRPYLGRTFLLVGALSPEAASAFTAIEPTRLISYEENGFPISGWYITVAHGFRGFPALKDGSIY